MAKRVYSKAPTDEFINLIRKVFNEQTSITIPLDSYKTALSLRRECHAMRQFLRNIKSGELQDVLVADSVEFAARENNGNAVLIVRPKGSQLSSALKAAGIDLGVPKAPSSKLLDDGVQDAPEQQEDILTKIGL